MVNPFFQNYFDRKKIYLEQNQNEFDQGQQDLVLF